MFLGLPDPDPDPLVKDTDSDPLLFSHKCVERTEIMLAKQNFYAKFQQKIKFLRLKIMYLCVSYKKNLYEKIIFFTSLKVPSGQIGFA